MSRFTTLAIALSFGAVSASAQEDSIQVELDAFRDGVVRSVEHWNLNAQLATYHPDAISVTGDDVSHNQVAIRASELTLGTGTLQRAACRWEEPTARCNLESVCHLP